MMLAKKESDIPPFPLLCEVRPDGNRVIIRLAGELDLAQAAEVQSTLGELIDAGFDRLVVDLRDVSFMDSTGLRTLMLARQDLRARGGRLSLVCNDGPVPRLLELPATNTLFDFEDARGSC